MTDSRVNSGGHGERPQYEDDPLMELSRIMDFGVPANDARQQEREHDHERSLYNPGAPSSKEPAFDSGTDDFSLDLERELLGEFDEPLHDEPHELPVHYRQGNPQPSQGAHDHSQSVDDFVLASPEDDFELSMNEFQRELASDEDLSLDVPEVPVQSDSEYDPAYFTSADDREPPSTASQQVDSNEWASQDQYQSTEPSYAQDTRFAVSSNEKTLEDELENILFGDEAADVSYPTVEALDYQNQSTSSQFAADSSHQPRIEEPSFDRPVASKEHEAADGLDFDFDESAFSDLIDGSTDDLLDPAQSAPDGLHDQSEPAFTATSVNYGRGNYSTEVAQNESPLKYDQHAEDSQSLNYVSASYDEPQQDHSNLSFNEDGPESADDDIFGLDDVDLVDDLDLAPVGEAPSVLARDSASETVGLGEDFFSDDDFNFDEKQAAEAEEDLPHYAHAVNADDAQRTNSDFSHLASSRSATFEPAPEIETLSVSEGKVEQTHSLDLPEINYGDEEPVTNLGDLETEFAEVFSTAHIEDTTAVTEEQTEADKAFDDIFRENASSYMTGAVGAAAGAAGLATAAAASNRFARDGGSTAGTNAQGTGNEDDFYNHWAKNGTQDANQTDYARTGEQHEDTLGSAAEAYLNRPIRGRRGLILASVAGAAVLLGGIGYHFLAGGGSGEPVVIHADTQPIKTQPENPGGVTVPNQDKAVYDRVAGNMPDNPEQKSLIKSGEDPVDISGTDDSGDANDQGAPDENTAGTTAPQPNTTSHNDNAPLVQPREVETMIVRPDGTIVHPTEPQNAPAETNEAPQVATSTGSAPTSAPATQNQNPEAPASGVDEIGAIASGNMPAEVAAPPVRDTAPAQQQETAPAKPQSQLPSRAPIVPSRPAEQPTTIVGTVPQRTQQAAAQQNTQVAAAASAAGAGGYYVQIASQPSAELAQKSYSNMAKKFGSVIGGRGVDIKQADIPGKGTYYRVRVQGGSKDEAIALCTKLKAAGGSCLVTR